MNWVIRSNKRMKIHTYLDLIVEPIKDQINNYNWIICDVEMNSNIINPPINMDTDYYILSPTEFQELIHSHIQFYWGVMLAVPISIEISLDINNLPSSEFNDLIWKNGNIQYPGAEIEIDCFDSGYTIVKFNNEELSNQFKYFFGKDAIPLQKFK